MPYQSQQRTADDPLHTYKISLCKDKRGVDLISDVLLFGRLWHDTPDNTIDYAMHSSRSHDAVIRVYDPAGNVINEAVFALAFFSRPQDRELLGATSRGLLGCPCRV